MNSNSPSDLILNAPPNQVEQPGLEPADFWIVNELRQSSRHADGGFLDDLLGLVCRQAGLHRKEPNQPAVGSVKLLPALRIIARLEPVQQAGPGFEGRAM